MSVSQPGTGMIGGGQIGYDTGTAQAVLDSIKPITDYTALRSYTGTATGIRITQKGLAGVFQYDGADTSSTDNGGTTIVGSDGRRWKRVYSGFVDVQWFGAKGDGTTNDTAAIQAAINTGKMVYISGWFVTNNKLVPVAGGGLFGDRELSGIRLEGSTTDSVIEATNIDNYYIDGITLDGVNSVKTSGSHGIKASFCDSWHIGWLKVINPQNWGVAFYDSTLNVIDTLVVEGAESSALFFQRSTYNKVGKVIAKSVGGFGVQIFDDSTDNQIDSIISTDGGLEALGINSTSHRTKVGEVVAIRCGDNGVSLSSDFNVVGQVYAEAVAFNGVGFYGSYNQVGVVTAKNIGQNTYTEHSGVQFAPAFGGKASDNIVGQLIVVDDQTTSTTAYAAQATNNQDPAWATGQVVSIGTWRKSNGYVYQAATAGTTGATAPSHTSGTVSDGVVNWTYKLVAAPGTRNKIGPTTAVGYITLKFAGTPFGNFFGDATDMYHDITFGSFQWIRRSSLPWTTSESIKYGDWRTNAGNLYVSMSATATASVAPTHTSGNVTGADGINWRYVEPLTSQPILAASATGLQAYNKISIVSTADSTAVREIYVGTGSPEAIVGGSPGTLYMRTDAGAARELYVKASGTDTTGWKPIQVITNGTTAGRPTMASTTLTGFQYFDTTLGKPIWWNGTGWVDSTGTTA